MAMPEQIWITLITWLRSFRTGIGSNNLRRIGRGNNNKYLIMLIGRNKNAKVSSQSRRPSELERPSKMLGRCF